jgi:hypothetical protein
MSHTKIATAVVGTLGLLLAATWALQLYSVPDPWQPYAVAVREYLGASLRGDSAALATRSAAAQPVAWVQDASRRQPALVGAWAHQLNAVTGQRRGETVWVALEANFVEGCSHLNSVTAQLLDHSTTPRLLAISSPCTRPGLAPLLPYQGRW